MADHEGDQLFSRVGSLVGSHREQLRLTLNSVLGLELQAPRDSSIEEEVETVEEEEPE
jgi:hypothetical protein